MLYTVSLQYKESANVSQHDFVPTAICTRNYVRCGTAVVSVSFMSVSAVYRSCICCCAVSQCRLDTLLLLSRVRLRACH